MIALTRLSHYALRVADVERSLSFYLNVVGIDLTERRPDGTAYLRRGPDHHCLALYPLHHAQSHDHEMAAAGPAWTTRPSPSPAARMWTGPPGR